jgi:hypothetical protein
MFSLQTLTLSAVLLSQICSTAAQLRRQNPKIKSIRQLESDQCATEPPTVGDTFTTFLEIVYELSHEFEDPEMYTSMDGNGDFDDAVQAIIPSYNDLIVEFDDPFSRRIDKVEILSLKDGGKELNRRRKLQFLNPLALALIQASGGCFLCPSDTKLSDQVSNRRQLATGGAEKGPGPSAGSKGSKGSKRGVSGDEAPTSNSGSRSCGKGKGGCLRPGLPTELEIQNAYDDELQRMHFDTVVGVQDLAEVEFSPSKSGKKSSKSCKKSSKSGKKSAKSGKKSAKSGKKSAKSGKKSAKSGKKSASGRDGSTGGKKGTSGGGSTSGSKEGKKGSEGVRSYPAAGDTHPIVGVKGKAGY